MRERLEQRLLELKTELDNGQKMLSELQVKQTEVTHTLFGIRGAIQVLEELLKNGE